MHRLKHSERALSGGTIVLTQAATQANEYILHHLRTRGRLRRSPRLYVAKSSVLSYAEKASRHPHASRRMHAQGRMRVITRRRCLHGGPMVPLGAHTFLAGVPHHLPRVRGPAVASGSASYAWRLISGMSRRYCAKWRHSSPSSRAQRARRSTRRTGFPEPTPHSPTSIYARSRTTWQRGCSGSRMLYRAIRSSSSTRSVNTRCTSGTRTSA